MKEEICISSETTDLINAIYDYMNKTSKKETRFTDDDYIKLNNIISILIKHLDLILEYEHKQKENK